MQSLEKKLSLLNMKRSIAADALSMRVCLKCSQSGQPFKMTNFHQSGKTPSNQTFHSANVKSFLLVLFQVFKCTFETVFIESVGLPPRLPEYCIYLKPWSYPIFVTDGICVKNSHRCKICKIPWQLYNWPDLTLVSELLPDFRPFRHLISMMFRQKDKKDKKTERQKRQKGKKIKS